MEVDSYAPADWMSSFAFLSVGGGTMLAFPGFPSCFGRSQSLLSSSFDVLGKRDWGLILRFLVGLGESG